MSVSLPAGVPAGSTPIGPIPGAAPGSISTFLYKVPLLGGGFYQFAGLPPVEAAAPTATTQPATPSGTVSSAPAASLDANTLANLLNGISASTPASPGYSGDPGTSYTYDSGLSAAAGGCTDANGNPVSCGGGGPNLLLWGVLLVVAIVGYLWWKKHHGR